MVGSEDSEKLALAATKGQILLSLRSGADEATVATRGITPPVLLAGGREPERAPAPAEAPRPVAPPRHRAPRPAPEPKAVPVVAEKQTVEILRGDSFERRDFDKGIHQ
jgi:pilus assembly protein CpaB